MDIGFIGAGRVGFSLGKFFARGGVHVTGYWSRHEESAREAAEFTGTSTYQQITQILQDSDALFLTVPDGTISSVYLKLRESDISGKQICHCSGALSAREAFPGIEETGACGYSIHPLFPVSSKLDSYRELTGAFFCLEGDGPHLGQWSEMLEKLGARPRIIDGADKTTYHAGCVFASNLVCALAWEARSLLEKCGFDPEEAMEALAPLMRANMEHILEDGPAGALTGPAERGDTETLLRHLACLEAGPEREAYRSTSQLALRAAREKNPRRDYVPAEQALKTGD